MAKTGIRDGKDQWVIFKLDDEHADALLESFREKLDRIERKTTPFADLDSDDETTHWAEPRYVGEIGCTEWTDDHRLRHPRFIGLREDKEPRDVRKEDPS